MNCAQVRARLGDHLEGDLPLLERTRADDHLEGCADCSRELRELRRAVALVRSLPDPDPPEHLVDTVLARIAAGDPSPGRLPVTLRRLFDPRIAAPLAAGIAGLVLLASVERGGGGEPSAITSGPATDLEAIEMWREHPRSGVRGLSVPRLLAIERATSSRFFKLDPNEVGAGFFGRTDPDTQLLDLDGQLDSALRDPVRFLHRVSEIPEVDRRIAVAPLVVRAGRRGDAAAVAGRLRTTAHPLAPTMAARFERKWRRPAQNPMAVPVSHH